MATVGTQRGQRLIGVGSAVWLIAFFGTVAWFLGSDLFEARDEKLLGYAIHIGGGSIVLLTGPFQFIAPIRNRYRRYHRIAGYTYVTGSVAAILGYFLLFPMETDVFVLSQLVALGLWGACVAAAVFAIRRKHVLTHQHNMARSFVLAAYFVIVRLVDRHLMWALEPLSRVEDARLAHSVAGLGPAADRRGDLVRPQVGPVASQTRTARSALEQPVATATVTQ